MNTFQFKTNINCGNCINKITPFLNELDIVDEWRVDTDSKDKILTVTLDNDDVNNVEETVKKAGFTITKI